MMAHKPMRLVFGGMLCEVASRFPDMVVLDADVSSSTQTKLFAQEHPERFFNFGIAEANMVGASAGMAAAGLVPVVSTFAFLLALRAADPVRSLIAYNSLNVKLAGGYAGLSDFADGASHQSVMDISVMRSMPNMTVIVPSDIETTRGAVRAMLEHKGPVYIRLSRHETGSYHDGSEAFTIGRANTLKDGRDITLAVTGTLLPQVLECSSMLERSGYNPSIVEYGTIKPFDRSTLVYHAKKSKLIVTIEEHNIIGGLGSAVSECLSENHPVLLKRIGIRDTFGESGSYDELLEKHRLRASDITEDILETMRCI